MSKLSDLVKNDVLKKDVYDKLVAKVCNIDTSDFALKTNYQTDKTELEKKITDVSDLATNTALTSVENKTPDVSNLVKKTEYETKVTKIENKLNNHNHDKYITTSEFNDLAADVFNARLPQANLITKTNCDAKLPSLQRKLRKINQKNYLLKMNWIS